MTFSSYPGFLESLDDFYIMDRYNYYYILQSKQAVQCIFLFLYSGLVMLQTTNSVINTTLYDYATPKALLAWQRVRTANWLASEGREWAFILAAFNSGLWARSCHYTVKDDYYLDWVANSLRFRVNIWSWIELLIHCRYIQQPVYGSGSKEDPPQRIHWRQRSLDSGTNPWVSARSMYYD